jgi:ubiquitin carboxyl-terminal hydrolase 14
MLMGSVATLQKPVEQVKFMEDMSVDQIQKELKIPAGLVNMGNTCYMNATLQCMRAIDDLKTIKMGGISTNPYSNLQTTLGGRFTWRF